MAIYKGGHKRITLYQLGIGGIKKIKKKIRVAKKLNLGLPRTNPASGQGGTRTWGFPRSNCLAKLPPR